MTGVDIAILSVISVSSLVGLFRGFVKEVFSLINWLAAITLAYLFNDAVGAVLPLGENVSPMIHKLAGGVLVFVLVLIIGGIISMLVHKLVEASGLSGTDRSLGFVFGLFRGAVIILALLMLLPSVAPVDEQSWWQSSRFVPVFLSFEAWARALMADLVVWANTVFS